MAMKQRYWSFNPIRVLFEKARGRLAYFASRPFVVKAVIAFFATAFVPGLAQAAPVSTEQAATAVQNWVARDATPLGAALGQTVFGALTYTDKVDDPLFHVVYLEEGGFVVMSADTGLQPVIAFSSGEDLDPDPANPLYAMLMQDMKVSKQALAAAAAQPQQGALAAVTQPEEQSPEAQWAALLAGDRDYQLFSSVPSVSDVRVAPLVQTKWNQSTVGGNAVYNYYTPVGPDDSANNYVCGCVATAMAQLMKFHGYPTASVTPQTFPCKVNNVAQSLTMKGGAYAWSSMPNVPANVSLSTAQRQAIGKLCYDAGVSVKMSYSSSGSSTDTALVSDQLKSVFGYASAVSYFNYSSGLSEEAIQKAVLVSLDCQYPVQLSVGGSSGGHSILADGYGYNNGTRYAHLNMGWAGSDDIWYTLPDLGTTPQNEFTFSYLKGAVFNVFPDSERKLLSGRVLNTSGVPVANATVEVRSSAGTLIQTLTSNSKGMYAFARSGAASSETFKLRASSGGAQSAEQTVTLYRSTSSTVGNLWGKDLILESAPGSFTVTVTASPTAGGTVTGGGTKASGSTCTVTATPNTGYTFQSWTEGATVLSTSPSYVFTVTGNRTLTANFEASSVPLATALDNTALSWTTSGNWYGQVGATHDGVDAARSGSITHLQQSALQTTVAGPGTLSFWWSVSSEAACDFLKFYVDGTEQSGSLSGSVAWQQKSFTIPSGSHTLQWAYQKDGSAVSGSDCGWVDQVVWTPSTATYTIRTDSSPTAGGTTSGGGAKTSGASCTVTASPASGYTFVNWKENGASVSTSASYTFTVTGDRTLTASFVPTAVSLATALDNTSLAFTVGGNAGWFGQMATKYDGVDAAQSGPAGNSQASTLQTTVTGPGTLSFWWSVSSEATYDFLKFFIDGTEQSGSLSGNVAWQQKAFTISTGSHTVQWAYQKDDSGASGSDCGWVDQVTWVPTPTYYTVSCSASPAAGGSVSGGGTVASGASCTLTATPAAGYVFQNWKEGATVVSASASYTFTVVGNRTLTAQFAPVYTVTATATPSYGGTVSGGGALVSGASCTLTATPAAGYAFQNWKEGATVVSASASYTFTVTGARTLTAVFISSAISLPTALDSASLSLDTSGNGFWYGQAGTTHDGVDAAQSGAVTNTQSSTLQITVTGPGTFTFWWAVSSEQGFDLLSFYVDDVSQEALSGTTVVWQQKSVTLGSGTHTLKWTYSKDGSVNSGSDAGWVDQVSWTPNTATYTITTAASPAAGGTTSGGGTKVVGSSCTVTAMASGGWMFSNWTEGGAVVSSSPNYTFTVSGNRALTATFTASAQLPDFTVESVVFSPTTATAGGTMTALITLKNQGSVAGTVGYVDVWLDRAGVPPDGSDSDAWAQVGELAPGAIYTLNHAFTVPQGAGTKTYRVFVDSSGQTPESNEANNQRTATYTVLAPIQLGIALDNSDLAFLTGGDANWVGQSSTSHDGVDAAQSGGISNSQTNSLLATVTGPGTLSFWWKVSSEAVYDTLSCSIDGAEQAAISGQQEWAQKTFSIAAGAHVVRWTYAKDGSDYGGSDCGWVDQVVWTPPSYTITASASPSAGGTVAGAGVKPLGSTCTLTATPNSGYTFASWKAGSTVVSTQPVYAFTVTGALSLTAYFTPVALRPDFVVQSITLSSTSVIPGDSMTATISVKNQGGASGSGGSLNVWIDRSSDAPVGSAGDGWASVGTLAAGASSTFTHTFTAPASVGNKTYRAFVDSADAILESDESNNQRGATYAVTVGAANQLGGALDCEVLTWMTSGNVAWYGQSGASHDGVDAAQSGSITHSQQSVFQTVVTGPGMLTFWWSVSSEAKWDKLMFYIDGAEQPGSISGSITWQQKVFTIPVGVHTLKWVYQKDGNVSSGSDCGWVDQLTFGWGEVSFGQETYTTSGEGNSGVGGVRAVIPVSGIGPVSVKVSAQPASATSADYSFPVAGTNLTWGAGESGVKYVTVPITGDKLAEGDELFYLTLGSPVGGFVAEPRVCAVTLRDDDAGTVPNRGVFVAGVPLPPEGGRVTGGAYCLPGKTISLTAAPNTGWTFLNWEDGRQAAARKVTGEEAAECAQNGVMLCTASFKRTAEVELPQAWSPGPQEATVGVAFSVALPVASECLPRFTVTGVPTGLKLDADKGRIVGVPTKAGTYSVSFTASNAAGTAVPQTFSVTVRALPAWAQGAFNGTYYKLDSQGSREACGVATMTATALGQITGKLTFGGTNYAFTSASYTRLENGICVLEAHAQAGKAVIPLAIDVWQLAESYEQPNTVPQTLGVAVSWMVDGVLEMYRNGWKDVGLATVATNYTGYYTAVLPGASGYGSGYLTFTVDKAGNVKTAGKLADGTAVSLSGVLILTGEENVYTVLYAAPTAYKGGSFFGLAEFVKPVSGPVTVRYMDDGWSAKAVWENRSPQATQSYGSGFFRELDLTGGWYDTVGNLYMYYTGGTLSVGTDGAAPDPDLLVGTNRYTSVCWNPAGLGLTVATNRLGVMTGLAAPKVGVPVDPDKDRVWDYGSTNTVGLTVALTRATGVFKGSFKAWFDYGTTHTSKTIAYEGALTPERSDAPDGVAGRGFFLWADKASYPGPQGLPVSYAFNMSYDFLLLTAPAAE